MKPFLNNDTRSTTLANIHLRYQNITHQGCPMQNYNRANHENILFPAK